MLPCTNCEVASSPNHAPCIVVRLHSVLAGVRSSKTGTYKQKCAARPQLRSTAVRHLGHQVVVRVEEDVDAVGVVIKGDEAAL